jgi:exopolyphosphatase / guanosine-5'-triphosphate,3'-diphosphate pyrophosphatase
MATFRNIIMFTFFLSFSLYAYSAEGNSVRAAIDIGSGATKLRVVEVDMQTQKIVRVLESKSFTVPYQEQLARAKDGNFDRQVMDQGIDALSQAKEIAAKYHAQKVIAVATAAFRKANNVDNYISEILQKTGIPVFVIDQHLEGELAFQAVRAQYGFDPQKLIVWDIGGGSFQLTTVNERGEYDIYRGHEASIPFKNYVVEKIQKQNPEEVSSPNPISTEELLTAQFHAISVSKDIDNLFREKIKNPSTEIVGVGNIFGYHVSKLSGGDTVTREQMIKAVASQIDKTDKDVGGGDFANVYVTNSILVLGFMEGLNIDKMHIADINPADGAFFYAPFWDAGTKAQMIKVESQPQVEQVQPVQPKLHVEIHHELSGCR